MIHIENINIVDLKSDIIVNAANEGLLPGGGVCGAIFKAADYDKLNEACRKIGHCDTGSAVITSGFNLSKYIIHAVGPVYVGGNNNEESLLYNCYKSALDLAREYKCKSIGFPLISSGIYGYPVKEAWEIALKACKDWLDNNEDIDIVFAILDKNIFDIGLEII